MTTIYDLPLEIIERINTIAGPLPLPYDPRQRRARTQFLLATSLVCRVWTPFAQQALWSDVELGWRSIDSFIAADPGRHPVHNLSVDCQYASDDSVVAVLRTVRGVRDLTFKASGLGIDWICGDNFRNLKTFRLYRTPSSSSSTPMHSLPFNLTTLVLQPQRTPSSFDLPDALTRQTSIHSLHIGVHDINYSPRLFSSLAPLAPQLVTLHIASNPSRPQAVDLLKHCSMLKHLTVDDMSLVRHVVVPLASWTVRSVTPTEISKILDLLESTSVPLGDLERLELHSNLWQVQYSPQWPQLEQRCREGKIKLVVHRTIV